MRLFCFLAVLSAVLSAAPARACCLFSCFGKGAAIAGGPAMAGPGAAGPAVPGAPAMAARTAETTYSPYLEIFSVGGHEVDNMFTVPHEVTPGVVDIIVHADASVMWWWIELYITELGMTPAPAAPAPAAAPAVPVKVGTRKAYKPVGVPKLKKIKPKMKVVVGVAPAPAAAPAAAPAPAPAGLGDEIWVWELLFKPDLAASRNYSAYAEGEWGWPAALKTSNTVTFRTASSSTPPGPPSDKGKGKDKDPPKKGPPPKKE